MKTLKLNKKFSLKKEKIAAFNHEQLKHVQGGGINTWITCPLRPTDGCWGNQAYQE